MHGERQDWLIHGRLLTGALFRNCQRLGSRLTERPVGLVEVGGNETVCADFGGFFLCFLQETPGANEASATAFRIDSGNTAKRTGHRATVPVDAYLVPSEGREVLRGIGESDRFNPNASSENQYYHEGRTGILKREESHG